MRNLLYIAIILAIAYLLSGCASKQELATRGKSLCKFWSSTLWHMDGSVAHCTDGMNFYNVDEIEVHEMCSPK